MRHWFAAAMLRRTAIAAAIIGAAVTPLGSARAQSDQPIMIGLSTQLTGPLAGNGRQILLTAQIWVEQINAKGGLAGRPVKLVHYDDRSDPANIPGIYAKLVDIDQADALISVATNMTAAAMPIVIQRNKLMISVASLGVNKEFNYDRYFQIVPFGPDGKSALSQGFFDVAMTMRPAPATVALVGADAEFSKTARDGAREHVAKLKLDVVLDRGYPPSTKFGSDGEWAKSRLLTIQFQNIHGNGIEQFNRAGTMIIVAPPQYQSGELKYPFAAASH
jgi:branched-chain amino acid transport system substrate-binding protein